MPPRYSYWTILAGGLPTAFRASERADLLPTFNRIREKHPDAEMKWFARGRLWASPEDAQADLQRARVKRDRDWRPGGDHRDPRQAFAKKRKDARRPSGPRPPESRSSEPRSTGSRPPGSRPPGSRPSGSRPSGSRPSWSRSSGSQSSGSRPPGHRPRSHGARPQGARPQTPRPPRKRQR